MKDKEEAKLVGEIISEIDRITNSEKLMVISKYAEVKASFKMTEQIGEAKL